MARKTEMVPACRFERANMGQAPFRLVGVDRKVYISHPGAPAQPAGTCDFCGTAIMYAFRIESADGKQWSVGCDCVRHTGDQGLIRRATVEQRKHDREIRHAREDRKLAALLDWWNAEGRTAAALLPHPREYFAAKGQTLANCVDWYLGNAGMSGKLSTLAHAQKQLANKPTA